MAMMQHPIAALFPEMSDEDFKALKADIEEYDQQVPIVHFENMILDGWHRYRACQELGIEPLMREWAGECGSPAAYVVSMNLHRRHLTATQRADIAAALMTTPIRNFSDPQVSDDAGHKSGLTLPEAAAVMRVSTRTVEDAKVVRERGTEREKRALKDGTASASSIAKQIRSGKTPTQRDSARKSKTTLKNKITPKPAEAGLLILPQKSRPELKVIEQVKVIVTELASMPPDVGGVVGTVRKDSAASKYVQARLDQAFIWLKDFFMEWRNATDAERDPAMKGLARF